MGQCWIVITDSNDSPETIQSCYGINDAGQLRIIRIPGVLDASQISQIFELEIRSLLETTTHALFVANVDTIPVEVSSNLAMSLNGVMCGICRQIQVDNDFVVTTTRPVYGGRLIARQRWESLLYFALLRSTATKEKTHDTTGLDAIRAVVHDRHIDIAPPTAFTITRNMQESATIGLSSANLILSGGRGVKTPENFSTLVQVADKLGAAVGASLPAVDMGLAPATRQVGQSGNYVKPRIYVAVGISGTPQHLAGIDPVTRIVAINSDDQAPIFGVAEAGVVADCETFLPLLLAQLQQEAAS